MLEEWRLGAVEPHLPAWRNWIACTPSKREVASSSLVAGWEGGVVGLFGVGGGRAPNYGGVGGGRAPHLPAWRNWIACTPTKREVVSSNLTAGCLFVRGSQLLP